MSRVTRPALRGTLLGRLLRFLNPLIRRLLASRLHWPLSRWLVLLRWTSPRTGRRRTLPVAYVREGSVVYLTTGDRWSADVERGSRVAIRLAGRWFPDVAATRSDPEDASRTLFRLFSERPWFRVLSGIPATSSGAPSRRALDRAIAAGRALVLISLDPEPVPRAGAESGL